MNPAVKAINVYNPLPWQIAPWRDKASILLLTGAAGGGKSRLAAEKMHGYCKKYPGAMGLMLRKNRNSMTNSTVLFVERTVIGRDPAVRHYPSKLRFEYDNGSILAYGGMADDEQREQIRSIGQDGSVDIIWMEEANRFSEDDFSEARARIRGKAAPWRQMILTTNPDKPTHWIKRRLMDGSEASVYYSKAADNPHNPPEYLETLESLTGILGKRLNKGLWVQAEGVVYDDFDYSLHVVEPFQIPTNWRRIRSVDFGFVNPFVAQWWAIDGEGRMYLYREIYMTKRTVAEHIDTIKQVEAGIPAGLWSEMDDKQKADAWQSSEERAHIETTVCDHDAEDRATMQRAGIRNVPATKAISAGIQAVGGRLKVAADGKPRMFFFRQTVVEYDESLSARDAPTCTVQEFDGYVWPKSADGKPVKEVPVDMDNHGEDALRYATMFLQVRGAARSARSHQG